MFCMSTYHSLKSFPLLLTVQQAETTYLIEVAALNGNIRALNFPTDS